MSDDQLMMLLVFAGLMSLLGVIAKIALALIGRRREPAGAFGKQLDEIGQRLARLEQSVDATAIEVERISEGQRFTTRLLAEREPARSIAAPSPTEGSRGSR